MERLNHPYYKETSGLYKYDYQAEPKYEGYCMDDYIGAFIVWIILSVIILFIGIFTWFLEYDVGVEGIFISGQLSFIIVGGYMFLGITTIVRKLKQRRLYLIFIELSLWIY